MRYPYNDAGWRRVAKIPENCTAKKHSWKDKQKNTTWNIDRCSRFCQLVSGVCLVGGRNNNNNFPVCHSRTLSTWGIFVFASPHLPPPVTKELGRKKKRKSPNFSRCWRKNAPKQFGVTEESRLGWEVGNIFKSFTMTMTFSNVDSRSTRMCIRACTYCKLYALQSRRFSK